LNGNKLLPQKRGEYIVAFFDDFADSVSGYPAASVALSYGSVRLVTGTTGSVNVNEVWGFKITAANNGYLNMDNVTIHFRGKNGAGVATRSSGPFDATGYVVSPTLATIPAQGSATTVELYFQAPATPSTDSKGKVVAEDVVAAHIGDWNGNLNYFLNNLSVHSPTSEKSLSEEVYP
jgi:hypothetical protein